jgi:hypothetical protein
MSEYIHSTNVIERNVVPGTTSIKNRNHYIRTTNLMYKCVLSTGVGSFIML